MKKNALFERRRDKRFQMKMEASFVLTPSCQGLGEIVDISKSGMAFQYIGQEAWPPGPEEVGVLFGGHNSCLEKVRIKTIADQVVGEASSGEQKMAIRRRSVEFNGLSDEQLFLLDYFIWINAVSQ